MPKSMPTVRCAIYTRKSTEEGLDQEFNSLHAQREAGEAYIKSQKHLGWTLVSTHYDDGGFTGGNLDRPALQQLLEDIDVHRIDCVVVYKVDGSYLVRYFFRDGLLQPTWQRLLEAKQRMPGPREFGLSPHSRRGR